MVQIFQSGSTGSAYFYKIEIDEKENLKFSSQSSIHNVISGDLITIIDANNSSN